MAERIDEIGFGGLKLIQDLEEFCYGVDAVILADFATKQGGYGTVNFNGEPVLRRAKENTIAVDLGTGTGIVPFLLSAKTNCQKIIGIEKQKHSCEMAYRNLTMNGLEERLAFIQADVKDFSTGWGKNLLGTVDMVTSNPPYTKGQSGLTNANSAKLIARHETTASLEDFLKCAAGLLKYRGDFFMVHRPSRLVDICAYGRKHGLEPKELCFVSPKPAQEPNILLVHMVKGGGKELKILNPLAVYNEDGEYSPKLKACYD